MNIREEFEAWYKKEIDAEADFFKHPATGLYTGKSERHFFKCWQAALAAQAQQPETLVNGFKDSHIVKSFEQICGYDLAKDLSNEYSAQETKEAFWWYKVGIDFASKNIRSRNESLAVQTQQPTQKPVAWLAPTEDERWNVITPQHKANLFKTKSHDNYEQEYASRFTVHLYLQSQGQQSQWMPIETAPTGKEFLLAFYYRHRPHDVLRRVVTFIDKDIIALGWSEIPPAPEGGE